MKGKEIKFALLCLDTFARNWHQIKIGSLFSFISLCTFSNNWYNRLILLLIFIQEKLARIKVLSPSLTFLLFQRWLLLCFFWWWWYIMLGPDPEPAYMFLKMTLGKYERTRRKDLEKRLYSPETKRSMRKKVRITCFSMRSMRTLAGLQDYVILPYNN